jgi:hypothetical protein
MDANTFNLIALVLQVVITPIIGLIGKLVLDMRREVLDTRREVSAVRERLAHIEGELIGKGG